jgi:hypothetical protein
LGVHTGNYYLEQPTGSIHYAGPLKTESSGERS